MRWVPFGAGAIAGYAAPQVIPYQDEIALVVCAAPVKIPRFIRQGASGYVIGRVARNIMARGIGTGTRIDDGTGWY